MSIALHRMFYGYQGLIIARVTQFHVAQLDQKFAFTWFDTEDSDDGRRCEHLTVCLRSVPLCLTSTPLSYFSRRICCVSPHPGCFVDQCAIVAFLLYVGSWPHELPTTVLLNCFIVAVSRPSMLGCGKIPVSRLMSKLPEQGAHAQYVLPLANQVFANESAGPGGERIGVEESKWKRGTQ